MLEVRNSFKDRLGGGMKHPVYDGMRHVGTITEVFRDVFYLPGSGKRFRTLKDAIDAMQQ